MGWGVSGSAARLRLALLAGVLLVTLTPLGSTAASGQALQVSGTDRALVLPPSGAVITQYENFGYELRFRKGGVEIRTSAKPFHSATGFAHPRRQAVDAVEELAFRLTAGARSRQQAVSRVLEWMGGNIRYDRLRGPSQEAAAVLERRTGYCTGVARLTVALLEAVEIPAREVPGYVVGGGSGNGPVEGYHRWVEVGYDDLGWVFSDPLATHHWVPANYVRLAREELIGDGAVHDAELIRRRNQIRGAGWLSGTATGILVRGLSK